MQHTLTPFLIRLGARQREEKGERQTERENGGWRGGADPGTARKMRGKEESRVCCIDFLAVWRRP